VSGLDEQSVARLIQLLRGSSEKTPDHILTGKLQISLKDSIPVVYRPLRLAYATDYSYKQIVHSDSDLELFPVSVRKSLFWFARI
jgi:hypothetical protein